MSTTIIPDTPSAVREAQERSAEATAAVIALDSAQRSAELDHGDEFASALRQCKRLIITAAVFSGGVNLLFLASPIYLTEVYNRVIPSGSIPTLVSLSVGLILALATMAMFDAVRGRILIRAAARLDRVLAHRAFEAIIDLSARNATARNANILRDLDHFRGALAGQGAQFFFDVPWMPLFLLVLFVIQPVLGLVGLLGAVLLLGMAVANNRATRESGEVAQEAATRSYRFTDAVARYAGPVRAMGMEDALAIHWHIDRETMLRRQAEGSDRSADMAAAIKFLRLVLQSAMIGVGGWLVVRGSMLPASIFAANVLLGRALAPLEVAVLGWRSIGSAVSAGRRVQKALTQAPQQPIKVDLPPRDVGIEMEQISYVPHGARQPALRSVKLSIKPGEAIGIVGPSGAGKTSLARLMVAVTAPTQGRCTIGGLQAKDWSAPNLAATIGYLPQTVGLFPGTIRDNIARFREDATDAAVVAAAEMAGVHAMILDLPDGYETVLGEGGSGLSGGQRQRVGLARALFGEPRLVVLDEPNANLDAVGEAALIQAIVDLVAGGANVLVVAHRPNLIAAADRILVVEGGAVTAYGPRAELIEALRRRRIRPAEASA